MKIDIDLILSGEMSPNEIRRVLLQLFRRYSDSNYIRILKSNASKIEYKKAMVVIGMDVPESYCNEYIALEITKNFINFCHSNESQELCKTMIYSIPNDGVLSSPVGIN